MDDSPEQQASAKLSQHLVVAVQVAESVIRLRQQHLEQAAAADAQAAAAARAERVAQHAADRLTWSPALDADWLVKSDLHDLGRAWGAATGWSDSDPVADAAARRVETRLSQMAPVSMARFDQLRETGWSRTEAMTDVLASVATEAHARTAQPRVFVADAAPSTTATDEDMRLVLNHLSARRVSHPDAPATGHDTMTADRWRASVQALREQGHEIEETVVARGDRAHNETGYTLVSDESRDAADAQSRADSAGVIARGFERIPDDPATLRVDEHAEGMRAATPLRDEQGAWAGDAAAAAFAHRRVTATGAPHAADVAADSYPHPFDEVTPPAARALPAAAAAATASRTRALSR